MPANSNPAKSNTYQPIILRLFGLFFLNMAIRRKKHIPVTAISVNTATIITMMNPDICPFIGSKFIPCAIILIIFFAGKIE